MPAPGRAACTPGRGLRALPTPLQLVTAPGRPQGNIKRDPAGYSDEFGLQWRHYKACLQLFLLKPSQDSHEFAELVTFIAHVSAAPSVGGAGRGTPGAEARRAAAALPAAVEGCASRYSAAAHWAVL